MITQLTVTVIDGSDHTIVAPRGRLFVDTSGPLRDALRAAAARERPRVLLDLSGVAVCDSSGLNLMVQVHRDTRRRGGWLRLAAVQPSVQRVLEATNLAGMLAIYDTVGAATGD